jgi:hypothetical protein
MSHHQFSDEQTKVVHEAIDNVLDHLGGGEDRVLRNEIGRVVRSIANHSDYDAVALTILAIATLGEPARRTG